MMRIARSLTVLCLSLSSLAAQAAPKLESIIALQQAELTKARTEITRLRTKSCFDIKAQDPKAKSGIYTIFPSSTERGMRVYCEMENNGGGWTLVWKIGNANNPTERESQITKLLSPKIEDGVAKYSDDMINAIRSQRLDDDTGYWIENLEPTCSAKQEGFVSGGCRFAIRNGGMPRESACTKVRLKVDGPWQGDSYESWCQQTPGSSVFCSHQGSSAVVLRTFGPTYENNCMHTFKNTRVWVR